jgi:hypothetical protein
MLQPEPGSCVDDCGGNLPDSNTLCSSYLQQLCQFRAIFVRHCKLSLFHDFLKYCRRLPLDFPCGSCHFWQVILLNMTKP